MSSWKSLLGLVLLIGRVGGSLYGSLEKQAWQFESWQKEVRHSLHQIPELGFNEHDTSRMVQKYLRELRIPFTTGWARKTLENGTIVGGTGIVAELGSGEGPCVALRADIDALPIKELVRRGDFAALHELFHQADITYKSRNSGRMHACGHDAHMAMLLGAARLLSNRTFEGTIRLLFQPAEEGGAGGAYMLKEGALSRSPAVEAISALHVYGLIPTGVLATRPGVATAAAQQFDIFIEGRGGHAAMPHTSLDPIPTALSIAQAINSLVARTSSPSDTNHSAVVSITAIETSSNAHNVIPDAIRMKGTMRTLSLSKMKALTHQITAIVESSADAMSQKGRIDFHEPMYPPVINSVELLELAAKVIKRPLMKDAPPTMGAEDFAFFSQEVPSLFLFLGTGSGKDPSTNVSLHNPHFVVDDEALPVGSATLATLALSQLESKVSRAQQAANVDAYGDHGEL